jgi:hypothetical protein
LRAPDHRFEITAGGDWRVGRFFDHGVFTKSESVAEAHWFPRARGEDYETTLRLRAGRGTGAVPFDELFQLGLERDNAFGLRAHIDTADGRKGSAPMGTGYALGSWETNKVIRRGAVYTLRAGPFVDAGRVYGPAGARFGPAGWMCDAGIEVKLRILRATEVVFTWGKDLRTGRNAWYAR